MTSGVAIPQAGLDHNSNVPLGLQAGQRASRHVRLALLACVVVLILPVWLVERFPSVDGPVHLYIIHILEQLARPGTNAFNAVFVVNSNIEPNFTIYGILWLLTRVFPYLVAEKLFITLYVALFAFSAYYLTRPFGDRSASAALLSLPLAMGIFAHTGLYSFIFSMALFMLAAGYAVRHLDGLGWRPLALLSLLMLLLALTHLVGAVLFLLYVGLYRIGVALRDALGSSDVDRWRTPILRLTGDAAKLLLAALPALLIIGSFLLRRVLTDNSVADTHGLVQRLFYIASVSPIFSLDRREAFALAPFVLLFWGLVLKLLLDLWQKPDLRLRALPLLLPPAVLFAFLAFGSLGFAGFEAAPRILPFAFFALIALLGILRLNRRWDGAIGVCVVGGLVATSVMHHAFYRQINELYQRYAASHHWAPPGSAVVEISFWAPKANIAGHPTGWRLDLTHHFPAAYAREKSLILLSSTLLSPHLFGYFPVRYGEQGGSVAAFFHSASFPASPEPFRAFESRVGLPVRQVSFWPRTDGPAETKWIVPEREDELRSELATRWRPLPRTSIVAPQVFVPRSSPGTR